MFKQAVKHESKLRLAIAGPSGSGKTYTALAVGTGLGKVAYVDTEHGSASKYADIFNFDVAEMSPPYHPNKYVKAINAASAAGYDVIVLDSLSHAWNGPGGLLEIVENASKKFRGNTYAGWSEGTPIQNALIEAIVSADIHIIGTMRSKQDYILTVGKNGKQTPQKVGMAPIQRDGFEYEFDVFLDMDIENNAIVSKTRCTELTGKVISKPGKQLADTLKKWLSGEPAEKKRTPTTKPSPAEKKASTAAQSDTVPDDELVIKEATAAEFLDKCVEFIPRYDNVHAVKNALKKLEYTGISKDSAGRLAQYRALKKHAAERDQEEESQKPHTLVFARTVGGAYAE